MAKKEKSLTSMCCAAAVFAVLASGYGSAAMASSPADAAAAFYKLNIQYSQTITADNSNNGSSNLQFDEEEEKK